MKKNIDVKMIIMLILLFLLNLADYYLTEMGFIKDIIIRERNFLARILGLSLFLKGKFILGFCLPVLYLGRDKRYLRLAIKLGIIIYALVLGYHIL